MDRFLRMNAAGMGMGQASAPADAPVVDTAEQVYISSLALLKMLKHGRAGKAASGFLRVGSFDIFCASVDCRLESKSILKRIIIEPNANLANQC